MHTSQQTTAEIMVKESRGTVGHVSRVRPINGRAVHLEFKFRMIMGLLEMNKVCGMTSWKRSGMDLAVSNHCI